MINVKSLLIIFCVLILFYLVWINVKVVELQRVIDGIDSISETQFLDNLNVAMKAAKAREDSLIICDTTRYKGRTR